MIGEGKVVKLYLYDELPGRYHSHLVHLIKGEYEKVGKLFQELESKEFSKIAKFVNNPDNCDVILLPHPYFSVSKEKKYIRGAVKFAINHKKKLLLFTTGDFHEPVRLPNTIVLRTASYKSTLLQNEIVIPAFVEDLGKQVGLKIRSKENLVPTIGFAGMVKLNGLKQELSFQIKTMMGRLFAVFKPSYSARYRGLYYRRRAVSVIENNNLCKPNFYIRDFFSASNKTIQGNPEQIRDEFISSIVDSDFALVVRGNGNFSLRFFEVLSLGRVPLFIDTDTPLPLEDEIDYDSFILRVKHSDIENIPKIINNFWKNISTEEYEAMQKRAREAFEFKLKPDVYLKNFFEKLMDNESI